MERALERYDRHESELKCQGRAHLNNSIEEGRGSFCGILGEEITYDFFPGAVSAWRYVSADHLYDYDLQLDSPPNLTADVKTKRQTYDGPPKPHYFATVCDKNTRQQCDLYWFMRVHTSCEKAWILGCMPKRAFFKLARFYSKGELDPTSHCGWRFKEDCWNLPIEQLWHPTTVAELQEMYANFMAEASVDDLGNTGL